MTHRLAIWTLILLPLLAWADKQPETVESLKARAEAAQGKQQVELYTKIAEQQFKVASAAYEHGDTKQAQAALADVVNYGVKAARAAATTGKRMKQTEISLRRITDQLENIRKSVDTDERPPVADAIQKLESARTDLLNSMFRK